TAVVKQHALAQPEGPGAELLVGLPALGQARGKVASLIDIGQAIIHRGSGMYLVVLIMPMRVETRYIGTRAIVEGAAPLRMPLGRLALVHQPAQGSTDHGGAGRGQKGSPADVESLCVSIHVLFPSHTQVACPHLHRSQSGAGSTTDTGEQCTDASSVRASAH